MCIHACVMFINAVAWPRPLSYWVVCVCVCVCIKLDVNWWQMNSHKRFQKLFVYDGISGSGLEHQTDSLSSCLSFPSPAAWFWSRSPGATRAIHGVLINSPVWQGCSLLCCFVFFYRHKLTPPPPRPPLRKKEPFKSCRQRSIQTKLQDQRHCRVTFDPTVPQGFAEQQKPVLHPSQPDKNMTGNYQFIQRMKTSR